MGAGRQIGRVVVGLVAGLLLTEGAFWLRDDGAFPHINVLTGDATLGARLTPDTRQRVKVADNPTSTLTINSRGWRGPERTAPGGIVVVGDSQVFGLGVDDAQTTPAQLAALANQPVTNGGVPTYGPEEYLKVIAQLCKEDQPETVVVVLNFANDLFELGRPNTERHRVWDGWAVRLETAPEQVTDFPGRRWLFSQSHTVYALRRLLHTPDETTAQGLPSEGSVGDAMSAMLSHQLAEDGVDSEEIAKLLAGLRDTGKQQLALDSDISEQMRWSLPYDEEEQLALQAVERRARPGDIVYEEYAEASRPVEVTAAMLRRGARLKRTMKADFEEWLADNPEHPLALRLKDNQEARDALGSRLDALTTQIAAELAATSPFEGFLTAAGEITDAHGAELVVVALPVDVQVDPAEWAKYGEAAQDMSETLVLLEDLVETAEGMGFRAVNAVPPLRNAQPGAFLNADIHLTPHGHAALAGAIHEALQQPAPLARPGAGMPEGRSRVPLASEWIGLPENTVRGSTRNNCVTRRVREWQRISCIPPYRGSWTPAAITLESGPAEAMALSTSGRTDLLTPLLPGQPLSAVFHWSDRAERLRITWEGDEPVMGFEPLTEPAPAPGEDTKLAACLKEEEHPQSLWFGNIARGCQESFSSCSDLISCAQGSRLHLPTCPEGEANAGAAGHCYPLCDDAHPCASGTCTDWQGGGVCL